jgi:hypothetical protein
MHLLVQIFQLFQLGEDHSGNNYEEELILQMPPVKFYFLTFHQIQDLRTL